MVFNVLSDFFATGDPFGATNAVRQLTNVRSNLLFMFVENQSDVLIKNSNYFKLKNIIINFS